MKQIIYFDIDYTLIDNKRLSQLFYRQISEITKVPLDKIIEAKEEYIKTLKSSTDYLVEDLLKCFQKDLGIEPKDILNVFEKENFYRECLFSETKEVLNILGKKYRLGIFSEGFEKQQINKLQYSGIYKYFDKNLIIIERRKLANKSLNKVKPGNYIVEDKRKVIEKLKEFKSKNFKLIWVNRKDEKNIDEVKTVKDLSEIENLLAE